MPENTKELPPEKIENIEAGEIVNEVGEAVGTHNGYTHYTIGQRKGLGLSFPEPRYVKKILPKENRIIVSQKENLFTIKELEKIINIQPMKISQSNNFFTNKSIVFTGSLSSLSRDEAKYLAKSKGAKILSSVSKNTDFVIVGDSAGSKKEKATSLGIKILTEEDFINKVK